MDALAVPTCEAAGQLPASACAAGHTALPRATPSELGSVTVVDARRACSIGCSTIARSTGRLPLPVFPLPPATAVIFGANGSLSQPVAWKGALADAVSPSTEVSVPAIESGEQSVGLRSVPGLLRFTVSERTSTGMPWTRRGRSSEDTSSPPSLERREIARRREGRHVGTSERRDVDLTDDAHHGGGAALHDCLPSVVGSDGWTT